MTIDSTWVIAQSDGQCKGVFLDALARPATMALDYTNKTIPGTVLADNALFEALIRENK